MKAAPIYILIIILIGLLVFKCDNKPTTSGKGYIPYEVLVEIHDTIERIDTFHHHHIKLDSVHITDIDTVINDYKYTLGEYHFPIKDSLLDGVIIARSPFKPIIDFKYKVKSYTIKDSTILRENNYSGFLYGGRVAVSPLLTQMSVGVSKQFRSGDLLNIEVGRDFSNELNIVTLSFYKRF